MLQTEIKSVSFRSKKLSRIPASAPKALQEGTADEAPDGPRPQRRPQCRDRLNVSTFFCPRDGVLAACHVSSVGQQHAHDGLPNSNKGTTHT